jgi:hypothetical protein
MELDSTTIIREKVAWIESQPIAWDKNQAWMRIERADEKPVRGLGYYAAAAVIVIGIALIATGDYTRDAAIAVRGIQILESGNAMSNVERRITNIEVGMVAEVTCGTERAESPLGLPDRSATKPTVRRTTITPQVIEETTEPLLMPEPVDGERIAVVENAKPRSVPVERVRAIFGVEEQPSTAIIKQGKKLKIYFLQTEISQSSRLSIDESSSLEARINKKDQN